MLLKHQADRREGCWGWIAHTLSNTSGTTKDCRSDRLPEILGVSRNTVRKYVEAEGEPRRREPDKRPQPVLEEVRERIDELLDEWGRRTTRKQRITGTLVHQQLLREGYQVGSTTVRAYLAEQRRARQEVYLPLVWRAGDAAQVDFFEVTVEVAGARQKGVAVRAAPDVLGGGILRGCTNAATRWRFWTGTCAPSSIWAGWCCAASTTT